MKIPKPDTTWVIILSLAIFNVIFHLIFYNNFEYHRDELLYFSLGTHPATGYATTPPLIGWLAFCLIKILGYSLFVVKLVPAILGGGIILVGSAITKELGGKAYAMMLTAISLIVAPMTMRAFFLFQPVFLDIFFWTVTFYYLVRYINTKDDKYLIILGVMAGIGMLNKYLIAILISGIILLLPLTKLREVFLKKKLYVGLILALVIFLPNMLWQIVHGLPILDHMQALHDTQLVYVEPKDFFVAQLFMPLMASFVVIPGIFYLLISKRMKDYRLISFVTLFTIILLLLLRGKDYYTAGLFPVLIASGAVFWERVIKWKFIIIILMIIFIVATYPILPLGLPIYKPDAMVEYFKVLEEEKGIDVGRRWEDDTIHPLPQDYADMIGWEELTRITKRAYDSVVSQENAVIYAENYGQAGAISVIGKKFGLPEPVSFHDSYQYWLPIKLDFEIKEFIYINDELGEDIQEIFSDIVEIGSISNPYAREFGTTVYLCRKPVRSFNEFYYEILEERGIVE